MKNDYLKPTLMVVETKPALMLCTSEIEVINPGNPNLPPAVKACLENRGISVWDE